MKGRQIWGDKKGVPLGLKTRLDGKDYGIQLLKTELCVKGNSYSWC